MVEFSPEQLKQLEEERPFAKLHELVYLLVEDAILSFRILPLQKIRVSQVSKSLEISRTPVQEAFENLYKVGLLMRSKEVGGYLVFTLNSNFIYQLFEIREVIETGAARICAKRNSKIDFVKMNDMCKDIIKYFELGDFKRYTIADNRFHNYLIESTCNPHLKALDGRVNTLFKYYWGYIAKFLTDNTPALSDRFEDIAYQHINIYKAIKLGSANSADEAVRNHLNTIFLYFCMVSQNLDVGMRHIQLADDFFDLAPRNAPEEERD